MPYSDLLFRPVLVLFLSQIVSLFRLVPLFIQHLEHRGRINPYFFIFIDQKKSTLGHITKVRGAGTTVTISIRNRPENVNRKFELVFTSCFYSRIRF